MKYPVLLLIIVSTCSINYKYGILTMVMNLSILLVLSTFALRIFQAMFLDTYKHRFIMSFSRTYYFITMNWPSLPPIMFLV